MCDNCKFGDTKGAYCGCPCHGRTETRYYCEPCGADFFGKKANINERCPGCGGFVSIDWSRRGILDPQDRDV